MTPIIIKREVKEIKVFREIKGIYRRQKKACPDNGGRLGFM